jgi:hypothetical protein
MKLGLYTLLLITIPLGNIFAGADTTYYLIIGKKKCPLILHEKLDSTNVTVKSITNPTTELFSILKTKPWGSHVFAPGILDTIPNINPITLEDEILVVKDTIKQVRYLKEKAASKQTQVFVRKTLRVDTVMDIDPLTLVEQQVVIPYHKFEVKNDLGNVDFNLFKEQIKTGLIIESKSQTLHVSEMSFYYETQADCGWLTLQYPNPDTLLLKKLNTLSSGGFIYVWDVMVRERFITEPVYLNTYFSINNALARPEATKDLSVIKRLPFPTFQTFQDSVAPLRYAASIGRLYVGIENQLIFSFPGIAPDNVHAIAEGNISVSQNIKDLHIFTVTAKYSTSPAVIHFMKVVNGDSTEICTDTFLIMRLPDPNLMLNGKLMGGKVSKESLKAMSGIVAIPSDHTVPARFTVKEIFMDYSNKGKISTAIATGPLFNAQMMQWINQSQIGDIFIIGTEKLEGPDGMPFRVAPMCFVIAWE